MPFFTKKPVTIEARQYKSYNLYEITGWCNDGLHPAMNAIASHDGHDLIIRTLEGQHIASVNDWIIKGVKGEFYPCKPDVFALTYEEAKNERD